MHRADAFDVAMPPAPPQNLSVALGKISNEGTEASFIVDFRTSPDFGGRPITACSYAIELIELSVNGTIVTQKTVPALPDAEQTELVTKMKPNTDYVAVVRTQCKVDPPAQGESGVLHGAESQNASFRVEPHREYAKQCAETGDFSTLVSKRCVPCPTEAEGAQCILGLLDIREGHWMPSVSLARAIETRDAKQTLFWKCKTSQACGSIAATIEDGPTAVPRSVCGVGFKGNLCGACDVGYGPLGDGCLLCPEWYVNFFMSLGMVLWIVINIGWQTYNTYTEARKRGRLALVGIAESKTGSLIKILLDYCQLVAALAFIKIDPPASVRRLFSVFALGSGVSASAMPVQCLLRWSVLSQTCFYMVTAFLVMFGPLIFAAGYWYIRYVLSRIPSWWARILANRERRHLARERKAAEDAIPQPPVRGGGAEGGTEAGAEDGGAEGGAEGGAALPTPEGEQKVAEEERTAAAGSAAGDDLQAPPAVEEEELLPPRMEEDEEEFAPPPAEEVPLEMHHRRRRSSLINILTESVAENDVKDIPGPVLQQLRRRYAEAVADPDGRATYAEFSKLVGAAAPSVGFVEDEWDDRKDESNTIGFDDFRVVMKKIEVRRTVVIVATATVVAVFFNYMKVSTQLVAIFMPSDVIDSSIYLSTDWDVPAYTPEHIATMVFAAITLLIFTVGAPIAALGVLIYMHKKDRLAEPEIFTMFGFLYAGYKPKYFWWESVVLLRKVAATVIALSPIGLELQAISATVLLGVFTAIQLVVRPFRNERHNVLDCSAMSSIALKQLCALAYHYVSMNTIDTLASQQRFTFVSWVVILVVMSTSIALIFFFMGQFTVFKIEEKNADRLMTVAAEQKAWRMDEEMELSTNEKVIAFAKRVLCAAWAYVKGKLCRGGGAQGGEVEHGEERGDTVVQVRGRRDEVKEALVAFTTESVAKHERELREIDEQIKSFAEGRQGCSKRAGKLCLPSTTKSSRCGL